MNTRALIWIGSKFILNLSSNVQSQYLDENPDLSTIIDENIMLLAFFFLPQQWKKLRAAPENWLILNCSLQVSELICLINSANPY